MAKTQLWFKMIRNLNARLMEEKTNVPNNYEKRYQGIVAYQRIYEVLMAYVICGRWLRTRDYKKF
jgi:hypothetical protein